MYICMLYMSHISVSFQIELDMIVQEIFHSLRKLSLQLNNTPYNNSRDKRFLESIFINTLIHMNAFI